MKKRVDENLGKKTEIVLDNGWLIHCKLLNSDDKYIEVLDLKKNNLRVIEIGKIASLEVKDENEV